MGAHASSEDGEEQDASDSKSPHTFSAFIFFSIQSLTKILAFMNFLLAYFLKSASCLVGFLR